MKRFNKEDKVIICTDNLETTEAEEFLTNLIGQTLQVVEITDEYKDTEVPTYKCKFITSGEIVMRYGSYFPFVDADLATLAE